ncbi:MAG TPA: hypothetical protein VLM79_24385 [Kofleriaceae bacterium]|nr:hypothetical protein [Kofleriaceae bacterium]
MWSTTRREALQAKIAAIDPGQGAARFARIAAAFDGGAERWSAMRVEACRATRVEGRQSELVLDRRVACLDRTTVVLIHALVGQAACLLGARRFDDAIARLGRALELKASPDAAFQVALARAYLGRAKVETRRDVLGGLAAVRSARAALAAAADATHASTVGEVDDWLSAHAP